MKYSFNLLITMLVVGLLAGCTATNAPDKSLPPGSIQDVLLYRVSSESGHILSAYDAAAQVSTPILADTEISHFIPGPTGQLAYTTQQGQGTSLFLIDTLSETASPREITVSHSSTEGVPLAWSRNGRYLAFESFSDPYNRQLYVWDMESETASNITPENLERRVQGHEVSWSFDDRLAFATWYPFMNGGNTSDIFLWDGNTTLPLSQSLPGEDRSPAWSPDGRLAFHSIHNNQSSIFVWDGVSVKDGAPDVDTFISVAPELISYFSFPRWTHDSRLAFEAQGPQDNHVQIYVWDGQSAVNFSRNPRLHNGGATWNHDGHWAFMTFFSEEELIYVRDAKNRTVLKTVGQSSLAWGSSRNLAFCNYTNSRWVLSVWNGKDVISIAEGAEIRGRWQTGAGVFCSSG